jgi:hypothetical protein
VLFARVLGLAVAVALGVCIVLYLASGERRYLRYAWQVLKVALALFVVALLLILGERLVNDL